MEIVWQLQHALLEVIITPQRHMIEQSFAKMVFMAQPVPVVVQSFARRTIVVLVDIV